MKQSLKQIKEKMSKNDLFRSNEILFNTISLMVKSSIGDVMTEYIIQNPPDKNQYLIHFKRHIDRHNSFYLEQIAFCFEQASKCDPKDSKNFAKIMDEEIVKPYVKECLKIVKNIYANKLK